MDDEKWMREALKEAYRAYEEGEIPIGAVVVNDNKIIGRGHNMTEALKDVTAHAEMLAITAAENYIGKYLSDSSLYVTVEPCLMCAGAIGWSRIKRIVYGTSDIKRGYSIYIDKNIYPFHPKSVIKAGVLEREAKEILQLFFRERRLE